MESAKTIHQIECELNSIADDLAEVMVRKRDRELRLMKLRNRVRTNHRLTPSEYRKVCKGQEEAKAEIMKLEIKIANLQSDKRYWSTEKKRLQDEAHSSKLDVSFDDKSSLLKYLMGLRDEYIAFAEDHTRVSSTRLMAGKFASQLTALIQAEV